MAQWQVLQWLAGMAAQKGLNMSATAAPALSLMPLATAAIAHLMLSGAPLLTKMASAVTRAGWMLVVCSPLVHKCDFAGAD